MPNNQTDRPAVTITTDGAATPNPGPGGWAALLEYGERERLLAGEGPERTTNNAMELYAAAEALEALNRPCRVTLRLDSTYVLKGLQRLLVGGPLPEKNRDLWARLLAAARAHTIEFEWVRGHHGDPRNERVDRAANSAAARAFRAAEEPAVAADCAEDWTLAICSAATNRPVRWALITPVGQHTGAVTAQHITQPTAVYQALVQGLTLAQQQPGAAAAAVRIVSNYELIVKQGRGEWRVKNPDQRELALQVAHIRDALCQVRFEFASTEAVLKLIE